MRACVCVCRVEFVWNAKINSWERFIQYSEWWRYSKVAATSCIEISTYNEERTPFRFQLVRFIINVNETKLIPLRYAILAVARRCCSKSSTNAKVCCDRGWPKKALLQKLYPKSEWISNAIYYTKMVPMCVAINSFGRKLSECCLLYPFPTGEFLCGKDVVETNDDDAADLHSEKKNRVSHPLFHYKLNNVTPVAAEFSNFGNSVIWMWISFSCQFDLSRCESFLEKMRSCICARYSHEKIVHTTRKYQ